MLFHFSLATEKNLCMTNVGDEKYINHENPERKDDDLFQDMLKTSQLKLYAKLKNSLYICWDSEEINFFAGYVVFFLLFR